MIPRACRRLVGCKVRADFAMEESMSVTRRTCDSVSASSARGSKYSRKLRTDASPESSQQTSSAQEGNEQREKIVDLGAPRTTGSYSLPAATWSLSDLNVATDDEGATETARAVLSPEEVAKLCALAHIELVPEGGGENSESLDVAAVQRDVGAMLRCMQTMRRERVDNGGGGDGSGGHHSTGENRGGGGEEGEEERDDGPWGGAVPWAAPLQEDVVSDGGIQEKVLGAAQRTEDGFFTAPRVVEK